MDTAIPIGVVASVLAILDRSQADGHQKVGLDT